MKKYAQFKDKHRPTELYSLNNLNFIKRNIIHPERALSVDKELNLVSLMARMGGTRGNIDTISQIRSMKEERKKRYSEKAAGGN